ILSAIEQADPHASYGAVGTERAAPQVIQYSRFQNDDSPCWSPPMKTLHLPFLAALACLFASALAAAAEPQAPVKGLKLKVSPNGRYFVDQTGKPFFYLGDTAWL